MCRLVGRVPIMSDEEKASRVKLELKKAQSEIQNISEKK